MIGKAVKSNKHTEDLHDTTSKLDHDLSISPFCFANFCFTHYEAMLLAYKFRTMTFWWINLLNIKCPVFILAKDHP